ncbi:hypothetical protein [Rhodococcus sp. NCIMB 12038]|uniref:hypothetical protein n=1 Tax=Rhodococcus sp. NCIMB 12038 TaxID=933800 RepID=UPI000B3C9A3F|nr:hypothetical protein [Rhodococcus sp. NCIMB 12038]OUS96426.1 hypothetical protein CA951_06670 [Rhodococcus sp. NCIMB 12038]
MDLGLIAAPKSANLGRIAANIDIFDFSLTAEEVDAITALDTGSVPPGGLGRAVEPSPGHRRIRREPVPLLGFALLPKHFDHCPRVTHAWR